MRLIRKAFLGAALLALVVLLVGIALGNASLWQAAAMAVVVGTAVGIGSFAGLRTYQFTLWIIVAVTAGMIYPDCILHKWALPSGTFDLRNKWLILLIVQTVMF